MAPLHYASPHTPPPSLLPVMHRDKVNMSVAIVPMAMDFGWSPGVSGIVQSSFFYGEWDPGPTSRDHLQRCTLTAGMVQMSWAAARQLLKAAWPCPGLACSALDLGFVVARTSLRSSAAALNQATP